jgi:O-antigen/teichoic acid export membrane protein
MISRLSAGVKHTLMYGFSIALMKGVSLIMLPIFAYYLTEDDFGRLEIISSLAVIGSILVGMGLEATLFRFVSETDDPTERKRVAANIFSLAIFIGLGSALLGWFLANTVANYLPGEPSVYEIQLTFFILSLEGCIAIPLGWLRLHDRVYSFFFITTGRALLQALLTAYMLWAGGGVTEILEASLIAAVLTAGILVYLQIKDTWLNVNLTAIYHLLIYSAPLVASGVVAFGLNGLDRWVLAEHATLSDVAHFGVAAKFSLALVLLLQPFNMWWSPRRFIVIKQQNGPSEVARFVTIGIVLTLILSVIVGLSSPLLIAWLLPGSYAISAHYVIGIVIAMACKEIADLVNIGCFTGETTVSQLAINVIAVTIGISAMLLLTPDYAVWGIIYGLIAAQATRLIMFFYISQHFLPLPYPKLPLLFLSCLTIASIVLGSMTSALFFQITFLLIATIIVSFSAVMLKLLPLKMGVQ